MIRLHGSRGARLAHAAAKHDSVLWKTYRAVGLALTGLSVLLLLASQLPRLEINPLLIGLAEIMIGFGVLSALSDIYYHGHTERVLPERQLPEIAKNPDWINTVNFAEYASAELARVLLASQKNGDLKLEDFLKSLLAEKTSQIILSRAGLAGKLDEAKLGDQAPPVQAPITDVDPLLAHAAIRAAEGGYRQIQLTHVLAALAEHHQGFANLMFAHRVEQADLMAAIDWFLRSQKLRARHYFWEQGKVGTYGVGRDWAAGYTPTLSQYATDLSEYLSDRILQSLIIGREAEINQIEAALSAERRANVLLVGEEGVGKTTIVNGFAARIAAGDVPRTLADKHVMQLDVGRLLAGKAERGQIEAVLLKVLNDAATAGNIVLYIDNIQSLLSAEPGKVGAIDASELLQPFLQSGRLQIIAATTPRPFHDVIARASGVAELFTRIDVSEPSPEDTIVILEDVASRLENRHDVFISVPVIRACVEQADRYFTQSPRPERAIRVLEATATAAGNAGEKIVSVEQVENVVSEFSKVPVGEVQASEKEKLLNLEQVLHERVIGQEEAVTAVAQALRRARSGLAAGKRPIGSFLFLGPTGVGKTETARALAEAYFGSEEAMIRLDMSEYQSPASLAQLIGASTGAAEASSGQLTSAVRDAPFSLVLLDEIEKAHPDILNVFLQVLDEGRVKDGLGRAIDFTNTIIIATSNAGSEFIRQSVTKGEPSEQLKERLLEFLQSEGMFRPEFLNRFDAIVAYKPLTQVELRQIVELQLIGLNKRLKEEQVTVELTEAAKTKIAELGYQPEFGARALRRVIQDRVENAIADRLLKGEIQRGQTATLDVADLGIEQPKVEASSLESPSGEAKQIDQSIKEQSSGDGQPPVGPPKEG